MSAAAATARPATNEPELAAWRSRLLKFLRMLYLVKWEQEKWLEQEPGMLKHFLGLDEMRALEKRINGTLLFLSDRDLGQMYFLPTGEQVAEHRVRRRLWMDAQIAIRGLLQDTLGSLLWVIEHRHTDVAEECAELVVSELLNALNGIKALYGNERTRKLFQQLAERRLEFPSVLSAFKKENLDLEKFVMRGLKLGAELPFAVDPKKTYTPYTVLAMQIVNWIDSERRHRWVKNEWRTADSVYRKVVPDLDNYPFHKNHVKEWKTVIAFHLDYFQAPKERRGKTAKKLDEFTECSHWIEDHQRREAEYASLVTEMKDADGNVISSSRPGWFSSLSPWGEITNIPAFKAVLRAGKDRNVTNDAELYNRVKYKVIEAAISLMQG